MPVDISKDLKKYIPIFQQAHEQNINESETSLRISKFLEDVLGYDVFQDITKEHTIKDRFVDYAIKVDGKVTFFVEIKQAGVDLREKHIEQASNYAANAGVSWVVLTNGRQWQLYHLTFDDGIQSDLILSVDLLSDELRRAADNISYLHKRSILKGELEDYYAKIKVLSPKSIIQAIFQEDSLKIVRRHLRKMSGITIEEDELVKGIKEMISAKTWESVGDIKVKRKRKVSQASSKEDLQGQPLTIKEKISSAVDETQQKKV